MKNLRRLLITDTRYLLFSFPAAIVSFCLAVAGVSAGLGTIAVFVGLPILAATAVMARNFADVERAALPGVLGRPVGYPRYGAAPEGAGWFRRVMSPLAGIQAVMDLLYAVIAFPIAVAAFVIPVVWWAGTIAGLTFPLHGWLIGATVGLDGSLPALLGLGTDPVFFVVFNTVIGVLFALTLVPVLRGTALIKASLAEALLTRPVYAPRPVVAGEVGLGLS